MASYLIYVPGKKHADAGALRKLGLEDLVAERGPECVELSTAGPDGAHGGCVCYWSNHYDPRSNPLPVYDAANQLWQPAKADDARGLAAGRFWLGYETRRPPAPSDLERQKLYRGVVVNLGDGNPYLVPVHRHLPQRAILTGGRLEERRDPRYHDYDEAAEKIFKWLVPREAEPGIPRLDGWEVAQKFLALNYRLNRDVCDWLGLLPDESIKDVCAAVIELPALLEIMRERLEGERRKKTAEPEPAGMPAGSST